MASVALVFVLWKRLASRVEPQIHVLNDGPIIVARTLSKTEVKEIESLARRHWELGYELQRECLQGA